jgi:hypothetical protein
MKPSEAKAIIKDRYPVLIHGGYITADGLPAFLLSKKAGLKP